MWFCYILSSPLIIFHFSQNPFCWSSLLFHWTNTFLLSWQAHFITKIACYSTFPLGLTLRVVIWGMVGINFSVHYSYFDYVLLQDHNFCSIFRFQISLLASNKIIFASSSTSVLSNSSLPSFCFNNHISFLHLLFYIIPVFLHFCLGSS